MRLTDSTTSTHLVSVQSSIPNIITSARGLYNAQLLEHADIVRSEPSPFLFASTEVFRNAISLERTEGWAAGFDRRINMGSRDNLPGFDADIYGAIAGFDVISENYLRGFAIGLSDVDVESTGNDRADIDTLYCSVYGSLWNEINFYNLSLHMDEARL